MNVVIEGCDGSGKSFLAEFLCKKLGMYYWHESSPRSKTEYEQMLAPGGVVFDRFCFGQFIYNKEEERKLTIDELKELVRKTFKETHTILILVDAHTDVVFNRLLQRGDCERSQRYAVEKWIKNIRGAYKHLLRDVGAEYIEIDGGGAVCTSI